MSNVEPSLVFVQLVDFSSRQRRGFLDGLLSREGVAATTAASQAPCHGSSRSLKLHRTPEFEAFRVTAASAAQRPHSIAWSARASSVAAISNPKAFAVLRLMTSSNFVGNSTGRSAGLSPFRMRPT